MYEWPAKHSAFMWRERYGCDQSVGDEDLEIVKTWDNDKFEEIDFAKWVPSSPRYALSNSFAGVPETTITGLKQA
jgi:oxalate decarboxylase